MIGGVNHNMVALASSAHASTMAKTAGDTAEEFEAMFLHMLLEPMEKAGEAFFGSGVEGKMFSGMFRQQIADSLAKQRPLGIADRVEASVLAQAKAARTAYEEGN